MGSNIIRTFDWRHVVLLARVRDRGLCMDSQLAFTRGAHALQNALLDPFIPGKSAITLVSRNGDIEAVPLPTQDRGALGVAPAEEFVGKSALARSGAAFDDDDPSAPTLDVTPRLGERGPCLRPPNHGRVEWRRANPPFPRNLGRRWRVGRGFDALG